MSDNLGSRAADASSHDAATDAEAGPPQESAEQPYDVPNGAQQYGQPPATGYQPPATDPPGQSAPVQGQGPQQYGQPEHGQASYAQEGFPQQPPHQQQGYESPQAHPGQQGYDQGHPGPQGYPGQQGFQGQQPYGAPGPYPSQDYPQPYGQQQAPMSDSDQRLWATLTNISIPFFGFIGPLVAYLTLKDRSPFLKDSTTEALNFSILYSIVYVVGLVLTTVVVGAFVLLVAGVVALVFCILAAIASNKGELYRYPVNWRLVK